MQHEPLHLHIHQTFAAEVARKAEEKLNAD